MWIGWGGYGGRVGWIRAPGWVGWEGVIGRCVLESGGVGLGSVGREERRVVVVWGEAEWYGLVYS